ncbi:SUMF1/EgtB/PvdO family nonheme iron enzyme [Rhabdochromatium marinum]|uniref:SUMF1/EgtB/PvdO family nonheme iron enzyme n=1 Tax=Rhabdochromatium marinum TaxID=48729 RepID=UPI001907E1A2
MTWRAPNTLERFLLQDARERWPEIIPLARLLVLAPRIEPLLLRNARQRFLPASDAELESQLWLSGLVAARSTREIVLHPGIACVLAAQLAGARSCPGHQDEHDSEVAEDAPSLEAIWTFTCEHTRHWSAEDRLERDLRYHALRADSAAINEGLEAILARIADESEPLAAGETSEQRRSRLDQRRIGLARLAKRVLPGLRGRLDGCSAEKARLLARYAALALGDGGDWSGEPVGAPEALPDWLKGRLPPPMAQSRLGVEVRRDDAGPPVLHFVPATGEEAGIELPSPLPGRLHIAPAGHVGAWHAVKIGSRVPLSPPSRSVRLTTLNGSQWELVAELPAEALETQAQPPLLLVHAQADFEQARAIAEWLRGQGIAVELAPEAMERRDGPSANAARAVRLWTQAMHDLWAASTTEPDQAGPEGFLLRIESVDAPSLGTGAGHLLDWLDWRRLAESAGADGVFQALDDWWRTGKLSSPEEAPSGAEARDGTSRSAEIARLLAEIEDPATEPPRRLAIGDRLAELGDPRPGVGTIEIEVPVSSLPQDIRALLDEIADPGTEPPRRLAIGDELARLGDPRPGVGLRSDGLPDIAWVEIPGGPFIYQDGETRKLPTFWIARYPVTNAQYQTFIDDRGYEEPRWWVDPVRPEPQPSPSRWPQPNRPRTDLDWYEAVAFTRWLNARLGLSEGSLRLPTELEWEKAARGEQGRIYPWGVEYRSGHANVNEKVAGGGPWYLAQATAVGLYPHGGSPDGVDDLAGNVLEWCLNKHGDLTALTPDNSGDRRALRGGSWFDDPDFARADDRGWYLPEFRLNYWGFRLLSSVPIEPVR